MGASNHCLHQLLPRIKSIPMQLRDSQCLYELPVCHYNLYKRSFVLRNLFLSAYWLFIDLLCLFIVFYCVAYSLFFFYNFLMAFVRLSLNCIVRSSFVIVITIFWKWIKRFWCQLAQVVHGARAGNGRLWGSVDQRWRSREAKYKFGGLAEASFSNLDVVRSCSFFGVILIRRTCVIPLRMNALECITCSFFVRRVVCVQKN